MGKSISYGTVFVQFLSLGIIVFSGPLIPGDPLLLGLELAGVFLGLWAIWIMQIGNFNITPDVIRNGRMVAEGPYKYIRHPMYAAVLLVSLAMILDFPGILRIASWILLLIDLLLKMDYEEKLLRNHYEGYARYQQQTRRIIPFIY